MSLAQRRRRRTAARAPVRAVPYSRTPDRAWSRYEVILPLSSIASRRFMLASP